MSDLIFQAFVIGAVFVIVLVMFVSYMLSEHYVFFWKVIDGIGNYLNKTYGKGKVL